MKPYTDQQMERSIANMLRTGVSVSAVVVLVGGLLYLAREAASVPDYQHFHPPDAALGTIARIFHGTAPADLAHLDPANIVTIGILLLIATPVVRVVYCVFGFARQRDLLYVAISAAVLAILIYSLIQRHT